MKLASQSHNFLLNIYHSFCHLAKSFLRYFFKFFKRDFCFDNFY